MEDKNWLAQTGRDFKDSDFGEEFGIPQSEWGTGQINKIMLDRVHAMNLAGYIAEGIDEKKARHMADKRRSMAIKAAKDAGLTL